MSPAIEKTMVIFFRGHNLAIHFMTNRRKTYFVTIALAIYQITSDTLKRMLKDKDLNLTSVKKLSIGQLSTIINVYTNPATVCVIILSNIVLSVYKKPIKSHECGDSKDKSAFVCLIKYKKCTYRDCIIIRTYV